MLHIALMMVYHYVIIIYSLVGNCDFLATVKCLAHSLHNRDNNE